MKTLKFLSPLPFTYLLVALALGLVAPVKVATSQGDSAEEHSIAIQIAHTRKLDPSCPPPTLERGNQCVLQEDVVLEETLELASDTKLNCRGHKLTPATVGVLDEPRTSENEFQPSKPELAILINEANSVTIQNCSIEDFDFGILSIKTKTPEDLKDNHGAVAQLSNKILQNNINVRTTGIHLLQSDNTLIAGNRVTYHSVGGRGIVLQLNSDNNKIIGNKIVSTDSASTGQVRRLPGGPIVAGIADNGIQTFQSTPFTSLLNLIINNRLFQVGTPGALQDPEDAFRLDNNLIQLNTLEDIGGVLSTCSLDPDTPCSTDADCSSIDKGTCLLKAVNTSVAGIQTNFGSANTIIRNNILRGWAVGISFGGVPSVLLEGGKQGTCSLDSSRLCRTIADCTFMIDRFGDKGTCSGAKDVTVDGQSMNMLAEGNIIFGSILAGIHLGQTVGSTVRGNIIKGPTDRGINLIHDAILSGTVERNIISGSKNGIALTAGLATFFGAKIRLNDITGYNNAVLTLEDYNLPSELSVEGKGNYWGLPCPGFDRATVRMENGEINLKVIDSHPYDQPVATTPGHALPATCDDPAHPGPRPPRNPAPGPKPKG
jgi:Right handed beta helix region/Periplasmic copper-binding protein (NosD)